MQRKSPIYWILIGGCVAGAFDITYATVFSSFRGRPPIRTLQSVASGILGNAAYEGGVPVALLGLVLHFFIAISMAAVFYFLSRWVKFLTEHSFIAGILYGVFLYFFMNLVVLPLSAYPHQVKFTPMLLAINLFVHMFLIGLPMSLAIRKATS